jgi:hypothetical protein
MSHQAMLSNRSLDFFQIYFRKYQTSQLYDFAKPIFNKLPTPYLENSVIANLVPQSKADLIAVTSWRLKEKRKLFPTDMILKRSGRLELTEEKILSSDFDIAILLPRLNSHKMLFMASHWHGEAWTDAFLKLSSFLKNVLNIQVPQEVKHAIYGNHFIAKRVIYQEYVRTCLIPVLQYMELDRGTFDRKINYRSRIHPAEVAIASELEKVSSEWQVAVFLLERLFSVWINERKFHLVTI